MIYTSKTGFKSDYTITDLVVRWNSNNRVPPQDVLQELHDSVAISTTVYNHSVETLATETRKFIAEYVAANKDREYTDEEKFEMRAAFEPGTKLVNIFTGKTHTV